MIAQSFCLDELYHAEALNLTFRENGMCIHKRAMEGGRNPLSPNSSEMAWNLQTPFYRMEAGSLRMVYVNFQKFICLRTIIVNLSSSHDSK